MAEGSIPADIVHEAWSEYRYPRDAVDDPLPTSGFARAMRVMHQWELDRRPTREQVWEAISRVRDAAPRLPNDADTDDIIDALVDANLIQLRGDR